MSRGAYFSEVRSAINVVLRAIQGPRSISLLGLLIVAPFSIAATIVTESFRYSTWFYPVLTTLIITAVDALVFLVANLTLLRNRKHQKVPLISVLIVYIAAGAVRPPMSDLLAHFLGSTGEQQTARFSSSIVASFAFLVLIAVVLDGIDRRQQLITDLNAESAELERTRASFEPRVTAQREVLSHSVTTQLEPELDRLISLTADTTAHPTDANVIAVAREIRRSASETIRPLSHRISAAVPAAASVSGLSFRPLGFMAPKQWRLVARDALLIRPFSPLLVPILFLVFGFPYVISVYGFPRGALALTVQVVALGVFTRIVMVVLTRSRMTRLPGGLRVIVFFVTLAAIQFAAVLVASPIWGSHHFGTVLDGFLLFIFVTYTVAVWVSLRAHANQASSLLRVTITSQRWELNRLENELREMNRKEGLRLHGQVQSQMSVVALSLETSANRADRDEDSLRRALLEAQDILVILRSEAGAGNAPPRTVDFTEALDEIVATWSGCVNVEYRVELGELADTDEFRKIGSLVLEVTREAVSNASRHGACSEVILDIVRRGDRLLLVADDDGVGPNAEFDIGLGLGQLNVAECVWSLGHSELGGARLSVVIPLDQLSPNKDDVMG